MPPLNLPTDAERDAQKYRTWSLALQHATQEIQGMADNYEVNVEDVLTKLLPDMTNALGAEMAFCACYETDTENQASLAVMAIYPTGQFSNNKLVISDTLGSLLKDGRPKVIDPLDAEDKRIIPGLEPFQATAAILVRVLTLDETYVVGVCNKKEPDLWPFLAADRMVLCNILELIATGARVGQRRQRQLERIRNTLDAITKEIELKKLLQLLVKEAADVFDAPAASVLLWDKSVEYLFVKEAYGLSSAYCAEQVIPRESVNHFLRQYRERSPFEISDLQETPYGNEQLVRRENLRSVLCAPLFNNHGMFGVLTIHSKGEIRTFSNEDKNLAQTFADGAAIAIRNAERYQSQAEELQAIQAISEAAVQQETHKVWEAIVRNAAMLTAADLATLATLDSSKGELHAVGTWLINGARFTADTWTLPQDRNSMSGRATIDGNPQYLPNIHSPKSFYKRVRQDTEYSEGKSAFCVPLFVQKSCIGTLYIESSRENAFTDPLRQRLQRIAPHAAIALQHAQLLREAKAQEAIRNRVIQIQTNIANILDSENQLNQIRQELEKSLDCSGCFIANYDAETQYITFSKAFHNGHEVAVAEQKQGTLFGPRRFNERKGFVDYVIERQKSLLVEDFARDPIAQEIDPAYQRLGIKSGLIIPMFDQDAIVGVIGIWTGRSTNAYSKFDQQMLEMLAPHVAIVIHNSQEHQQRIKERDAVSEFQRKISELDIGNVNHDDQSVDMGKNDVVDREIDNIHTYAKEAMDSIGMPTDSMFLMLYDEPQRVITFPLVYENGCRIAP
ncbi:MAG: GAF domain-containing protein, partial [Caldilineaceae bacterium]|nr:GAF domain-containing protein [Caldilineaceae bacterium]